MKVLIIDQMGLSLDFSLRCIDAGHDVRVFIRNNKDGSRCKVGDGLIKRVSNWQDHMNWADLIFVCDNTFYIYQLDDYKKKGYPILGPSHESNQWEQNREFGAKIMEAAGIKTIPCKKFENTPAGYSQAIAYVKEQNRRFVSKPIGDGDKKLSYVAKSPADLVYMLEKWKKEKAHKGPFILQDFRPGIEMAVGGWFGANGFSKYFLENWEFKKLMNDDLGVATGEQGTVMRYVTEEQSLLAQKVLCPLSDMLHAVGHTGYVDVNCIITEDGTPWPLEFTMRPGWPLFQIQQALHKGDPCEWMLDLLNGEDTLRVSKDVAVGVVISMPDYPYDHLTKDELSGIPIYGVERDNIDHYHLSEVMWGKAPAMVDGEVKERELFVSAGSYVMTVSATGKSIKDANCKAYKYVKKVDMPNSIMYRTDIGHRLEKQLEELQEMGYCEDLCYESGDD